jgi:hypothetical protein
MRKPRKRQRHRATRPKIMTEMQALGCSRKPGAWILGGFQRAQTAHRGVRVLVMLLPRGCERRRWDVALGGRTASHLIGGARGKLGLFPPRYAMRAWQAHASALSR